MKRDIGALVVARGGASLLQAVTLIALARATSVDVFGGLAIVISSSALALAVAEFGMATLLSRSRARGDDAWVSALVRCNRRNVAIVTLVAASVVALVDRGSEEVPGLVLVVLAAGIEKDIDVTLSIAVADGKRVPTMASILLRRGLALALYSGLVWLGLESVTSYGFGTLAAAVVALLHRRGWFPKLDAREVSPRAGEVLAASWPFFLAGLPLHVRQLEAPIVGWASGATSAGLYSAASRLISPLLLLASAASAPVMPHAARSDVGVVKRAASRLLALCVVGVIAVAPFVILAEQVMTTVFGGDYVGAGPVLRWFLVSLPLIAVASPLEAVLQAQGFERRVAARAVLAGLSSLALLVAGAVAGGPVGAAAGLCGASAVRLLLLLDLARRSGREDAGSVRFRRA